jgi:hypothetical protein
VRLEQSRKEPQSRRPDVKATHYETRTAAPAGATPFKENTGPRYEERKPAPHPYDEHDRYFEQRSSGKYYDAQPRYSSRSSRPEREPIRAAKVSSDRTRSERTRTRDREERRERAHKFVSVEDDSSSDDAKARYESEYRRRSDEEAARKAAEYARLKAETRRSYEEDREPRRHRSGEAEFDRQRKLSEMEHEAVRYISRSKADGDVRPSPGRTTSRDARPDPYESRSRRPEPPRRSSARPRDRPSSSGRDSHRDRKVIPEIVDWDDRKAPPPLNHSSSSPAEIHLPRTTPQRAQTAAYETRRVEKSPPPMFRRSETMPSVPSSSRRREATVPRSSGLRGSETTAPREPEYPTIPAPRTSSSPTTKYYYTTPGGGVSLRPEDLGVANGHRTILREPERHRTRSPSPLSRPPIGANRPKESSSSRHGSSAIPPPPLGRAATSLRDDVRDRPDRLYGEIPSAYTERERSRRETPGSVSYSKKIGPDDISWSPSRRRDERDDRADRAYKPTLGRTTTYVY